MIVSVSRRTDVPAFYFPWFLGRLREGRVLVCNPMNHRQIRQVLLDPEHVDGFVFWSKYPASVLEARAALEPYPYYIQYTLNGYGEEVEGGLPPLERRIQVFRSLADALGRDRVVWRYDPVCMGGRYTLSWHEETFGRLAELLEGYTGRCVISFLDMYRRMEKRARAAGICPPGQEEMMWIGEAFSCIAVDKGILLESCAEEVSMEAFGIGKGACIDAGLLSAVAGREIVAKKDRNQRTACGCAASVDIGVYGTCRYACAYCYAGSRGAGRPPHDTDSPFLT